MNQLLAAPRIISGGQTGADQGALFAARDSGFETGGYAADNYNTEAGPQEDLLRSFGLKDSGLCYAERTKLNVKEAEFTIWFGNPGTSGFWATKNACKWFGKPFLEDYVFTNAVLAEKISNSACVNIAGNRESHNPGIRKFTQDRMTDILQLVNAILKDDDVIHTNPLGLLCGSSIVSYEFEKDSDPAITSFTSRFRGSSYRFDIAKITKLEESPDESR